MRQHLKELPGLSRWRRTGVANDSFSPPMQRPEIHVFVACLCWEEEEEVMEMLTMF